MKLSIYLAEDRIQVILGGGSRKIKISHCRVYELKAGTLINDVIANEEALKEALTIIRKEYGKYRKKIRLILGGSRIMARVMEVPPMPESQLLYLTRKELEGLGLAYEDMVCDYSVICSRNAENKGGTILCAGIERQVITEYQSLFADCGMRIESMDIALNCVIKLTQNLPELFGRSYILAILDGRTMLAVLCICGNLIYTTRRRLVADPKLAEFREECIKTLSAIVRFSETQKTEAEVEQIYLCGLEQGEKEDFLRELEQEVSLPARDLKSCAIPIQSAPGGYCLSDYIYTTGSLYGK